MNNETGITLNHQSMNNETPFPIDDLKNKKRKKKIEFEPSLCPIVMKRDSGTTLIKQKISGINR